MRSEGGGEGGVLDAHAARDAGLGADAGALARDGGQLMEAVRDAGGIQHEADRQRGGAGADVKMIARPQVAEVVLQPIGPRRQRQEIGRGAEGDLDLGGRPAGRAGVKGHLRGHDAAKGVVGEVRGQHAVGGLQAGVGIDEGQEVLDEGGNGGAGGGVGEADGHLRAIGLGELELEPVAYDRRVAGHDAQVAGRQDVQERRPGRA